MWLEVLAAIYDTGLGNLNLVRSGEGNQLFTGLHAKSWEIISGAVRPLEVDLSKARVFLGGAAVLL